MSFDIYADDFQSLQDALNEAATTGKTLHLTPRARYAVTGMMSGMFAGFLADARRAAEAAMARL